MARNRWEVFYMLLSVNNLNSVGMMVQYSEGILV